MSKIEINENTLSRYGMGITQFLSLLVFYFSGKIYETIRDLSQEGLITATYQNGKIVDYQILPKGDELVNQILHSQQDKQKDKSKPNDINKLVEDLRSLFPEGKKDGTAQYWKGGSAEIRQRINSFFKKYGWFEFEEIIEATQKYVESFAKEGSYKNMRLLKYFIWKRENKLGEIQETSDLLSFLENKDADENFDSDWTTKLRL